MNMIDPMANRTVELQANVIAALWQVEESQRLIWGENAKLIAGALMDLSMGPVGILQAIKRLEIASETAQAMAANKKEIVEQQDAVLVATAENLLTLAHQYKNDLLHPPSADSRERRLAAIDAVISRCARNPPR